jgi:hypothetical protein
MAGSPINRYKPVLDGYGRALKPASVKKPALLKSRLSRVLFAFKD